MRDVHGAILREKDDPRDGYEPIPLWLVSAFMALVFWAGAYLAFNSGGFQSDVYNPTQVSWTGGGGAAKGPPDPMVVGKRIFTARVPTYTSTSFSSSNRLVTEDTGGSSLAVSCRNASASSVHIRAR